MTELGVIEWHFPNGTVQKVPLKNVLNTKGEHGSMKERKKVREIKERKK